MKRHVQVIVAVLCALGVAPALVRAQQVPERERRQQLSPAERESTRQQRFERLDARGARDARDARDGGQGGQDRRGMSRDERQQLRRDIGDHGRDIYGGQQGGFRPGQGRPQRR